MDNKNKYEFFETRYNEEIERTRDLQKKAQIYLSIISIVTSLILVNLSELKNSIIRNPSLKFLSFVLLILLFILIVLLIYSIRLKKYRVAFNPSTYIDEIPETKDYPDYDFYENRIADFIVSIDTNQKVNQEKASWLRYCEYGIFGLLFVILLITLLILL